MGLLVPKPHTFSDSHVLIYSINTRSLILHKNDVFSDYNLKMAHILCFNETHFNTLTSNNTSLNTDTRTHSMISVNGQNGIMIIYDNSTTLSSHETFTSLGVEYIAATLNANIRKAIDIIAIYIPSTLSLSMFIIHLQKFLDLMPISCRTIIIGDFNINMYDHNSTQPNELQSYMDQWNFNF
jgi:exonuclease III